jgi:hypothetical protein
MTLNRMPAQMIAGDSLRLAVPSGDYPESAGWAVALVLQALAGGDPVTVAATADGEDWAVAVTSAVSTAFDPGPYRYMIAATKDGDRSTIDSGQIEVLPDPAKTAQDQRSPARRALDAIDAVLENRASSEDMKFTFADGRALDKVPHADLLALRKHYARIVAREATKGRGPKRVLVRL